MNIFESFDTKCVAKADYSVSGFEWVVFIDKELVVEAAERMKDAEYHLESIHAVDGAEGMLVNYLYDLFGDSQRVCVRALLEHSDLAVASIAGVYEGAEWHERETYDFHGITFEGNPNFTNLLLPGGSDIHPLVKEEKKRVSLAELLSCGEIVSKADDFTLLDGVEESVEEAAQ